MARIEMIQIKNFRVLRDVKFGSSDSPGRRRTAGRS